MGKQLEFNDRLALEVSGFQGFKAVQELWSSKKCIPKVQGVYLVINLNFENTKLISPGVGGFFKGKDPNVSISELESNIVPDSQIVYIGKAGGPNLKSNLYSRLGQYLSFGRTKNVGHSGGRYIWQLENHADLIFCWKPTPSDDPREVEREMIADFIHQFGKMPFANLSK